MSMHRDRCIAAAGSRSAPLPRQVMVALEERKMEEHEITRRIIELRRKNQFCLKTLIQGLFFIILGFILLIFVYKQVAVSSRMFRRFQLSREELVYVFATFNMLSFALVSIGLSVANRSLKNRRMEAIYSALLQLKSNQLMERDARNSRPSS